MTFENRKWSGQEIFDLAFSLFRNFRIVATISEAGTGIGVTIRDSSDTVKVAMAQPLPFVPPF